MPASSSSLWIRKPMVFLITHPITQASTKEYTSTAPAASACAASCAKLPLKIRPVPLAKNPRYRVPMTPPTRWIPTTSSESSNPSLYFRSIATAHTAPVSRPRTIAHSGVNAAHDGVIATRPATAPDAAPTEVGFPSRIFSTMSQARSAAAGAARVFTQAVAAVASAASSDPALKPNHPNQSNPAPRSTNGGLCGTCAPLRKPTRLPSTSASARPAAPALMGTAVPPAKSSAPARSHCCSPNVAHPPSVSLPSESSVKLNTQLATGKYTTVAHTPAKTIQAPNLARSAMAPETRATVIIAKVAWKATNAIGGYFASSGVTRFVKPTQSKLIPRNPSMPWNPPEPAPENAMA